MDVVGVLLTAVASGALKGVIGDEGAKAELAGGAIDAMAQVVGQLAAGQAEVMEALTRLEEKVDKLAAAPYATAIDLGYRTLSAAAPAHRSHADRERLLDNALQQFMTAVATAPTAEAEIEAELLVAACWLAKGDTADFLASCERVARLTLDALVLLLEQYKQAPGYEALAESKLAPGMRAWHNLARSVRGLPDAVLLQALTEVRTSVRKRFQDLIETYNSVQRLRRAYGVSSSHCVTMSNYPREPIYFGEGDIGRSWDHPSSGNVLARQQSVRSLPHLMLVPTFDLPVSETAEICGVTVKVEDAVVTAVHDYHPTEWSRRVLRRRCSRLAAAGQTRPFGHRYGCAWLLPR